MSADFKFYRILVLLALLAGPGSVRPEPYPNGQDFANRHSVIKGPNDNDVSDYLYAFCNDFSQIPFGSIGSQLIKMGNTPFSLESYFTLAQCQSARYSNNIKSPILHIVVDEPYGREKFLAQIFKALTLVSKQPKIIASAVNAKNTKGETLLDYLETLRKTNRGRDEEQISIFNDFSALVCENGGKYNVYSEKSC